MKGQCLWDHPSWHQQPHPSHDAGSSGYVCNETVSDFDCKRLGGSSSSTLASICCIAGCSRVRVRESTQPHVEGFGAQSPGLPARHEKVFDLVTDFHMLRMGSYLKVLDQFRLNGLVGLLPWFLPNSGTLPQKRICEQGVVT